MNRPFAILVALVSLAISAPALAAGPTLFATVNLPGGVGPAGVALLPSGASAYVCDENDDFVRVINTTTNAITANLTGFFNNPFDIAVTPNGSYMWVSNLNANNLTQITTATNTMVNFAGAGNLNVPAGIAVRNNAELWVVSNNTTAGAIGIVRFNATTGAQLGTILNPAACNNPRYIAFNPSGSQAWITYGSDRVAVIDGATYGLLQNIILPGGADPYGVAVSAGAGYVCALGPNQVRVYATGGFGNIANIGGFPGGSDPWGIALHPSLQLAFVACSGDGTFRTINTANNTLIAGTQPAGFGSMPLEIAVHPNGLLAYVTANQNDDVWVMQLLQATVALAPQSVTNGTYTISGFTFAAVDPLSGTVTVTLNTYNPLITAPVLQYVPWPYSGAPIAITLGSTGPTTWQGTLPYPGGTNDGLCYLRYLVSGTPTEITTINTYFAPQLPGGSGNYWGFVIDTRMAVTVSPNIASYSVGGTNYPVFGNGNVAVTVNTRNLVPSLFYWANPYTVAFPGVPIPLNYQSGTTYTGSFQLDATDGDGLARIIYVWDPAPFVPGLSGAKGGVPYQMTWGSPPVSSAPMQLFGNPSPTFGYWIFDTQVITACITTNPPSPWGTGNVSVTVQTSQPVPNTPTLVASLNPNGGGAPIVIPVTLTQAGNQSLWTGTIPGSSLTVSGSGTFSFSVNDSFNVQHTGISCGGSFVVNTDLPSPTFSINPMPEVGFATPLTVSLSTSQPLSSAPSVTINWPSGSTPATSAVTMGGAAASWQGSLAVPSGVVSGNATIGFTGTAFNGASNTVASAFAFAVDTLDPATASTGGITLSPMVASTGNFTGRVVVPGSIGVGAAMNDDLSAPPVLSFADAWGNTQTLTLAGTGATWGGAFGVTEGSMADGVATFAMTAQDNAHPPNTASGSAVVTAAADQTFIKARGAGGNGANVVTSLVTAKIPSGALAGSAQLIISSRLPVTAPPANPTAQSGVNELKPTTHTFALGLSDGTSGLNGQTIELVVPWTDAGVAGLNPARLVLGEWTGAEWKIVAGSKADVSAKTVTAKIVDVKSYYRLFEGIATDDPSKLPKAYVQIAPNPVRSGTAELRFYLNDTSDAKVTFRLFDAAGEIVQTLEIQATARAETRKTLDFSGLGRGTYTYVLEAGGTKVVKRLAVIK